MARILVIGGLADSLVNFRGILLSEMVARGHEVIACAAEDNREIADKLTAMGVRYTPLHFRRAGLNPLGDLALLFRLLGVLRQLRPDIVLCYTIKPVIYGALACRLTGIKQCYAMITGLGYAFMGGKGLRQKWVSMLARTLYRAALTGTAGVFFQNPDDLALFIETGLLRERYKALVINGSGIDTRYFSPAALPHGPVVFLLIARLLKDKGIFEYASAAAILKQRYPEAIFRLLGPLDPNPNSISSDQLRTWQQAGVLDYLGEASDVRPHLAASCVYVLPSYREGTPRTVLEAMSMGRPVITTDAPGCRETVTDGDNGFLVPVKDSSALAHAMERFILTPELMPLMGARGREIACLKYDVHAVNDTILRHMNLDSDDKTPV